MPRSTSAPPVLTRSATPPARGREAPEPAAGATRSLPASPRRLSAGDSSALARPPAHKEHKSRPYLPDGKGRSHANFNCKVTVATPTIEGQALVVCRELAYVYAHSTGKKADVLGHLQSPETIHTLFTQHAPLTDIDAAFSNQVSRAPESTKRLIDSDHLGSYLAHVAEQLAEGHDGRSEANIMLLTATHAMAAQVQCKPSKSVAGASYFAVTLYEPNITGNHHRMEVSDLADLDRLTLHDLNSVAEGVNATGGALSMVAVCHDTHLTLPPDKLLPSPDGTGLWLALHQHMPKLVHTLAASLANPVGPILREDLMHLLEARNRDEPALHWVLSGGTHATMTSYAELLKAAVTGYGLQSNDLAHLLSAKAHGGMPALHQAVKTGNTQTLAAFAQALDALPLSMVQRAQLLAGSDARGKSALHVAYESGKGAFIDCFAEVLRGFKDEKLSRIAKQMLFDAVSPDSVNGRGVSGREAARMAGHTQAVAAYDRNHEDFLSRRRR
jgi:ShET2 enterotoxin, N-terminal region